MEDRQIVDSLYSKCNKSEYGDCYEQHFMDQYKLYVEMADRISERRAKSNSFFITVISSLIALIGLLSGFGKDMGQSFGLWLILSSALGLILCINWYFLIDSYRELNSKKFHLIHLIENKLPINLYQTEWYLLGEGEQPKGYRPLVFHEKEIPKVFSVLFISIAVIGVYLSFW